MEVILLERVAKLGQMGEVVRVKDGFARNYLLPKGKALRATQANKSKFETMKVELQVQNLAAKGEAEKVGLDAAKGFRFMQGRGCGHCRGTGYKGRKAIAEILQLNDEIRELIVAHAPVRLIKEAACRNGTRLLRDAALDMVRAGETSLQEINRVTFVA